MGILRSVEFNDQCDHRHVNWTLLRERTVPNSSLHLMIRKFNMDRVSPYVRAASLFAIIPQLLLHWISYKRISSAPWWHPSIHWFKCWVRWPAVGLQYIIRLHTPRSLLLSNWAAPVQRPAENTRPYFSIDGTHWPQMGKMLSSILHMPSNKYYIGTIYYTVWSW